MRQGSISLITSGDMGATITSMGVNLISAYAFSIQAVWSTGATPVGTFKLQASNDAGDNGSGQGVSQPTNWTDVANSSQAISGNTGSVLYDVPACSYRWVRLVYTRSSGSATLNVQMNVKGI